jgi:chemotaxis protein MotB
MPSPFSPNARPDRLNDSFFEAPAEEEDNTGWLVTFSDLTLQLFAFALVAAALSGLSQVRLPSSSAAQAPQVAARTAPSAPAILRRSGDPSAAREAAAPAAAVQPDELAMQEPVAEVWIPARDAAAMPAVTEPAAAAAEPRAASAEPSASPLGLEFVGPPVPPIATTSERLPAIERPDPSARRVAALGDYLQAWLAASGMASGASVEVRDRELVVSLSDAIGFAPGRAELQAAGRRIVAEVRSLAAGLPGFDLDVSGHTDDRPIRTKLFPSNLELSLARAAAVAQEISLGSADLRTRTFARGFGELRPIAPNAAPEGRARNRRVEIRLVPAA